MTPGYIQAMFTVPADEEVEATNSGGGPAAVAVTAGAYYLTGPGSPTVSAFLDTLEDLLNAGNPNGWTVSLSTDGFVTIDCSLEPFSLSMSSSLKSLLGFAGDIVTASTPQTGTTQARGFWAPDCTMGPMVSPHDTMPESTDQMQVRSPQGLTVTHVGNVMTSNQDLHWTHVSKARTWKTSPASTDPVSLQQFMRDTQWGLGHSWFSTGSKVCILAHDGTLVGGSSCAGWYIHGARSMESIAKRRLEGFDGRWTVRFASLSTDG